MASGIQTLRNFCKCCFCAVIIAGLVCAGPLLHNWATHEPFDEPIQAYIILHGHSGPSDLHNDTQQTALIITNEIISDSMVNTAQILIERGDKVIIASELSKMRRMEIMKTLSTNKTKPMLMTLNTSDLDSINDFITRFESNYSALNILIESTESTTTDQCDVDKQRSLYLTQRLLPSMQLDDVCRIIYMTAAGSNAKCQRIYTSELNQRYANNEHQIYTLLLEYGDSMNNTQCAAEEGTLQDVATMSDAQFIEFTKACQSKMNRTAKISQHKV